MFVPIALTALISGIKWGTEAQMALDSKTRSVSGRNAVMDYCDYKSEITAEDYGRTDYKGMEIMAEFNRENKKKNQANLQALINGTGPFKLPDRIENLIDQAKQFINDWTPKLQALWDHLEEEYAIKLR